MIDIDICLMRAGDLEWFHSVRNNPETFKYLHSGRAFSLAETKEWFRDAKPLFWVASQAGVPGVFDRFASFRRVGYFRTNHVNYTAGSIQIGMDIAPEFRGQGFAEPAYEQFINFLETHLFKTFTLEVLSHNHRAIHLYEKLGFIVKSRVSYPVPGNDECQSIEMELKRPEIRGAKVIPLYFGDRRQWLVNERDSHHVYALLEFVIRMEHEKDPGMACDTIFVVNECGETDNVSNSLWKDKCEELIQSVDGKLLKHGRGKIRVIRRNNVGVSFAAYDEAFHRFGDEYDVWFFCEDDQVVVEDNVFLAGVEVLRDLAKNIGFVAVVGLSPQPLRHAHGGCGITTTPVLRKVLKHGQSKSFNALMKTTIKRFGPRAVDWNKGHQTTTVFLGRKHLPWYYPSTGSGFGVGNKETEILGEVAFTHVISHAGYVMVNHPQRKFIVNWKNAGHDKKSASQHWVDGILRNCHGEAERLVPYEGWMDSAVDE